MVASGAPVVSVWAVDPAVYCHTPGDSGRVPHCDLFLSEAVTGNPNAVDEAGELEYPYSRGDVDLFNRRGEGISGEKNLSLWMGSV